VEHLRKVLGLESVRDAVGNVIQEAPLPVWANFRQRALDTAIAEINKKTDLNVAIASLVRSKHRRLRLRSKRCRTVTELVKSHSATSVRPPDFVEPMKAKLVDSMPSDNWIYEIKFDGYRALALRGGIETRILSRNQKDLGSKFPEVKESIAALNVQDAMIDGEVVALDEKGRSSFQLLQSFDMGEDRPPIVFYAFDLLRLNGKDLRSLPIEERKTKLEQLLKTPPGVIRYSVSFTKDVQELLNRARELGLEGLIGKRIGSRYEAGKRTGAWIKLKLHQEQEFVIGGYTEPEGSRKVFWRAACRFL
jgi:bifunctional non-homologous end joining protein LigD